MQLTGSAHRPRADAAGLNSLSATLPVRLFALPHRLVAAGYFPEEDRPGANRRWPGLGGIRFRAVQKGEEMIAVCRARRRTVFGGLRARLCAQQGRGGPARPRRRSTKALQTSREPAILGRPVRHEPRAAPPKKGWPDGEPPPGQIKNGYCLTTPPPRSLHPLLMAPANELIPALTFQARRRKKPAPMRSTGGTEPPTTLNEQPVSKASKDFNCSPTRSSSPLKHIRLWRRGRTRRSFPFKSHPPNSR